MSRVDAVKADKASAVLRVELLEVGDGDKVIWDTVRVEEVLLNKTRFRFEGPLLIGHHSWKQGLVARRCTVYLEPYPLGEGEAKDVQQTQWMLLAGDGAVGSVE